MTTTTPAAQLTDDAGRSPQADAPRAAHSGSGRWPWAAFVAGVTSFIAPILGASNAQPGEATDPMAIYERVKDNGAALHVGMDLALLSALALAVFAVGFLRFLTPRTPHASLALPLARLGLTAAVTLSLAATMLKMAFRGGLPDHGDSVMYAPESIGVMWPFVEQLSYTGLWPLVLTMTAVAVLSLRHRTLPTWFGVVSAVLAGVTLAVALVPGLPYFAGLVGPLWLIVSGIVVLRTGRVAR